MNIDLKILNKILEKQIQEYIKIQYIMLSGIYPGKTSLAQHFKNKCNSLYTQTKEDKMHIHLNR